MFVKCTAKLDLPPFLNFDGSSFDLGTWKVRCCLQHVLPYSHTSRVHAMSWPCGTNPILPASQISLPLKRMAGANTMERTFPLCACLSLHLKRLLSSPSAAASQTAARDAVAASRTDFHALHFANVSGKNCTNPFKDDTRVDDEEEDDDDAVVMSEFNKYHLISKHFFSLF